jgi:subtilisin-like proprotein convertase family protein
MKRLTAILVAMSMMMSAQAQTTTNVFQQTPNEIIPDANPTGLFSTIVVGEISGDIQSVTVMLNIANGFNGDLFAFLSFDSGYAVLLNRIGKDDSNPYGSGSSGIDVILSDAATADVHLYDGNVGDLLTGTWQPDGRETDPQLVVSSDPRTAMLSSFNNLDPNGTWTLYVADMASGYQSTLVSWGIIITTVPEPTAIQFLAAFGGLAAAGVWWQRRKKF